MYIERPNILDECRQLGGCKTGEAKITGTGKSPAKCVIHTVGPIYQDGAHGEPELLAFCYRRSLEEANKVDVQSIAFPAIGCGVYGYPIPEAADIAIQAVREFLTKDNSIEHVLFVLFLEDIRSTFEQAL